MARIEGFEIFAVDLPFKQAFKHSAAERTASSSVFLKCITDSGESGFGECLPREYVTGESRNGALDMLCHEILPRIVGKEFNTMGDVEAFLWDCDGKTPGWIDPDKAQTAAWCALDLALLDAFGRHFGVRPLEDKRLDPRPSFRYSGALSAEKGLALVKSALKQRLFGIRQIKLKVGGVDDAGIVAQLRKLLGRRVDIRVDANMAWSLAEALETMKAMAKYGVASFEQPLAANNFDGLHRLVQETGLGVMVDESFSDRVSLERLIEQKACTGVNVRLSKCGGLIASLKRAREALKAGLEVQVGCQVGESSLLSAAQLILTQCVQPIKYFEGCFGRYLLQEDPVSPIMQFGYGGRPPELPDRIGLGISVDKRMLEQWTTRVERVV